MQQQQRAGERAPVRSALEDNALVSVDGSEPHFPALVDPTDRWNGWLCPAFTRAAAEGVVEMLNAQHAQFGDDCSDRAEWDGDVVVVHTPAHEGEPGYRPERVAPDDHGRYSIGAYCYTWTFAPAAGEPAAAGGEPVVTP